MPCSWSCHQDSESNFTVRKGSFNLLRNVQSIFILRVWNAQIQNEIICFGQKRHAFIMMKSWKIKPTQCTLIFRSMLCSHRWTAVKKICIYLCIYLGRNRTVDQVWGPLVAWAPVLSYNSHSSSDGSNWPPPVDWSIYRLPYSHPIKFSVFIVFTYLLRFKNKNCFKLISYFGCLKI